MPDFQLIPLETGPDGALYRYNRNMWRSAGVDNYTKAPGQNPDLFQELTNILPPETNVLQRRWGYEQFSPKLDTGGAITDDRAAANDLYGAVFDGTAGDGLTPKSVTFAYTPVISFEFWFQTTSSAGGCMLSLNANSAITGSEQTYLEIYMDTTGHVGAGYYNNTSVQSAGTTSLAYNDGQGYHCVVTFNGATIIIYINGVAVLTTNGLSPAASSHAAYIRIAHGSGGTGWPSPTFFSGFLSHVSYWNFVLSAATVLAHYNTLALNTGSQLLYEVSVENDGPQYFWYLNETPSAPPPIRPTIVQSASVAAATYHASIALPAAVTPGNTLLLLVYQTQPPAAMAITDTQSQSYTSIGSVAFPNSNGPKVWAYYTNAATGGNITVTATGSVFGAQDTILILVELYSVNSSPVDGEASASGTSTAYQSPSITTAASPDIVFAVVGSNDTSTLQSTGGFALVANQNSANVIRSGLTTTLALAQTSAASTGSFQSSWTQASLRNYCAITFGIKLVTPSVAGSLNIYDYADANIGTYHASGVTLGEFIVVSQS